jgi:hypothetical protein
MFAVAVLVSMIDPFGLVACIAAGVTVKNRFGAAALGLVARGILQAVFVPSAPTWLTVAALVAGALTALIANLIYYRRRPSPAAPAQSGPD